MKLFGNNFIKVHKEAITTGGRRFWNMPSWESIKESVRSMIITGFKRLFNIEDQITTAPTTTESMEPSHFYSKLENPK